MKNLLWAGVSTVGLVALTSCHFSLGNSNASALDRTESFEWEESDDGRPSIFRDSEDVRRLVFAPGTNSTSIDGFIDGDGDANDIYLIEVNGEGSLTLNSIGNVVFSVETADSETIVRNRNEAKIDLSTSGDYQVRLEGEGDYQLTIETTAIASESPTRIEVLPGMDGAIAQGQVRYDFGERDIFIFNAIENQIAIVELMETGENGQVPATFTVKAPTGRVLADREITADFVLPERGDYEILVEGDAPYQLQVMLSDENAG